MEGYFEKVVITNSLYTCHLIQYCLDIIPLSYDTFLAKPYVILIMNSDAPTYGDIWLIHCHYDHPAYRLLIKYYVTSDTRCCNVWESMGIQLLFIYLILLNWNLYQCYYY